MAPRAIPLRPIDLGGSCCRSGDCCKTAGAVVMTTAERDVLLSRRPDLAASFGPGPQGFVALAAERGCPLLQFEVDGRARCAVHDIRPTNCRRFWCGRPDPTREPFELDPISRRASVMGCTNLTDRALQSRPFRRLMVKMQRRAMRAWGYRHGWRDDVPATAR